MTTRSTTSWPRTAPTRAASRGRRSSGYLPPRCAEGSPAGRTRLATAATPGATQGEGPTRASRYASAGGLCPGFFYFLTVRSALADLHDRGVIDFLAVGELSLSSAESSFEVSLIGGFGEGGILLRVERVFRVRLAERPRRVRPDRATLVMDSFAPSHRHDVSALDRQSLAAPQRNTRRSNSRMAFRSARHEERDGRAGERKRRNETAVCLFPTVDEIERQRDREQDHENHAQDQRDARQCD